MNRMILLSPITGLASPLSMGVFVKSGSQSGPYTSSERSRQPTISARENNGPDSSKRGNTSTRYRNLRDTSNAKANRYFSDQRDQQSPERSLKQAPHDDGTSSDSGLILKPDFPANTDTKIRNVLRKNRLQFRTLPDERVNFTLTDLDGETHTLRDHRGEWVLINFWAPWIG